MVIIIIIHFGHKWSGLVLAFAALTMIGTKLSLLVWERANGKYNKVLKI